MKEIPAKIFAAITERWDVFFTEENQWSVYGYIYFEGEIHSFHINRKAQYDELIWSRSIEEALNTKRLEKGVRPWIRQIKKREEKKKSS